MSDHIPAGAKGRWAIDAFRHCHAAGVSFVSERAFSKREGSMRKSAIGLLTLAMYNFAAAYCYGHAGKGRRCNETSQCPQDKPQTGYGQ